MRILVNCCQAEKNYNPFYEMLAMKLCSHDANFKYTFKYCLWDYLKDLERLEVKQIVHLSKLFGRLMATELPLHFLKVLDFDQLSKPQVLFLHLMLESLLSNCTDTQAVKIVFERGFLVGKDEGSEKMLHLIKGLSGYILGKFYLRLKRQYEEGMPKDL